LNGLCVSKSCGECIAGQFASTSLPVGIDHSLDLEPTDPESLGMLSHEVWPKSRELFCQSSNSAFGRKAQSIKRRGFARIFAWEFIDKGAFYVSIITKTGVWRLPSLCVSKNCCIVLANRVF
jgi:hypothetical protein